VPRGSGLTAICQGLGLPPQDVRLEKRRRPCGQRWQDRVPRCRIVVADRTRQLGSTEPHPPPDLVVRERVGRSESRRRGSVALDRIARSADGLFNPDRITRGPRPHCQIGSGVRGVDREIAQDERVVCLDEPIEPLKGDGKGRRQISVP
jgi:hypothetical protein